LIDAKEITSNLDAELTFCKENSIRSQWKINSLTTWILMNLCRILRPIQSLVFHLNFGCNTTITGGEVLAAAATQHTLQISIQHK
jgi:hypothetical protein